MIISKRQLAGITGAAAFGGILEFYDLYAASFAAALAWPKVFFGASTEATAVVLSLFAFLITYFMRPLGSLFFGHFGDRIGRKSQLVATILIMSGSMLIVGVLPGYTAIGVAAPILLTLLRAVLGFGIGGEFGGAASLVTEAFYDRKWRYFWASFANIGPSIGFSLSSLGFALVSGAMNQTSFLSIGWRIPFIIGAVAGAVGVVIRYRVMESPIIEQLKKERKIEKAPIVKAFKGHWKTIVLLTILLIGVGEKPALLSPFGANYFTKLGVSASQVSYAYFIATLVGAGGVLLAGALASIFQRKKILFVICYLITAISAGSFFYMCGPHPNLWTIALFTSLITIPVAMVQGLMPGAIPEQFPPTVRYTAVGSVLQFSQTILSAIVAVEQPYFISQHGIVGAATYIALVYALMVVASSVAAFIMKETKNLPEVVSGEIVKGMERGEIERKPDVTNDPKGVI